jgi:hypothetical protein
VEKKSERAIQISCKRYFNNNWPTLRKLFFKVNNEAVYARSGAASDIGRAQYKAQLNSAEGVEAGVADMILLIPNKDYHFACIEFKRPGGKQRPEQMTFEKLTTRVNGDYQEIDSLDKFKSWVSDYMRGIPDIYQAFQKTKAEDFDFSDFEV